MKLQNIDAIKDKIGDRECVVSVSGGKDSTAVCLALKEAEIPYRAVHMDTGWEHKETIRYVKEELPKYIGPITTVRYEGTESKLPPDREKIAVEFERRLGVDYSAMVRVLLRKRMFPNRMMRWCTNYLKVQPIKKYLDAMDREPVSVMGIRAQESKARSEMPEWEWWDAADVEMWRPILGWTFEDVIAVHRRHDVIPNRDYLKGATRVGCWPCIHAPKAEIRRWADADPERVSIVRDLEKAVWPHWVEMREKNGKDPGDSVGWFLSVDRSFGMKAWSIDEAIAWSRTKRGGRQSTLFNHEPPSCMRWGMCEVVAEEDRARDSE